MTALLTMAIITLPHLFDPRPYQLPLLDAMDSGYTKAVQVWHRRAGKEKTDVNIVAKKMAQRVGSYYYVFPELKQGRKVIWDGADRDGFRFLDHFPYELLEGPPNSSEMKLRMRKPGAGSRASSLFQIIGSDHYEAVLGTNPIGMVLSEYSLQDPACRSYFRPILAENGGWEIVNFTPRGENHAYDLWEMAKADPKSWFTSLLTVDDTKAIPQHVLDQERREIMRLNGNDALYLQEYFCSFTVPISGAYYSEQISAALRAGRIGQVPHEPRLQVDTAWDLGMNDRTSIWFTQSVGAQTRVIDYMEGTGKGIPDYISEIKRTRGSYVFGRHIGPQDIEVRDLSVSGGKTRRDIARSLGFDFEIAPRVSLLDGIDTARSMFDKCWFDKEKCRDGLNALKNYRKQYDEKRKTYLNTPYHDWASNGADAFRYMALAMDIKHQSKPSAPPDRYNRAMQDKASGGNHMGVLG